MTWDSKQSRWIKMYKGQRYTVACSILGAPATKEQSYRAANAWWEAKRAEVDSANRPTHRPPLPLEDVAAAFLGSPPTGLFDKLLAFWSELKPSATDARETAERDLKETIRGVASHLLEQGVIEGKPLPEGFDEHLPPARLQQLEAAVKGFRGEASAPPDRTIKAHADSWLATLQTQASAGNLAADRVNNVRMCLTHFSAFLGETANVESIDAARLQAYYLWCLGKVSARRRDGETGWSVAYAKETFAVARTWIRWLWEQGIIDLPKNIASRSFKFGGTAKKIETWSVADVRHVIDEAPGKLKLALLLMVNAGMTQADVSDLRDSEVDWKLGRIIRKRSKTAGIDSVPVVNYPVWSLTFELLKKYRSGGERVLLTESGKPYVRKELVNGKLVKADGFTSNFKHLQRRLKFTKPMKLLRKTGASLLESHEVYGRLVSMYLGHSPRSMKDKHYAAPSQALFDEAVKWLGRQLGQAGRPAGRRPA
jgi:integrase